MRDIPPQTTYNVHVQLCNVREEKIIASFKLNKGPLMTRDNVHS